MGGNQMGLVNSQGQGWLRHSGSRRVQRPSWRATLSLVTKCKLSLFWGQLQALGMAIQEDIPCPSPQRGLLVGPNRRLFSSDQDLRNESQILSMEGACFCILAGSLLLESGGELTTEKAELELFVLPPLSE